MRKLFLLCLALCLVAANCATSPSKEPVTRRSMHGVIQSVDAGAKTVTVKHDKIEGFMGAMTMEYPVKDPGELASLRKGETIDATVFVQDADFWLGEIKEKK